MVRLFLGIKCCKNIGMITSWNAFMKALEETYGPSVFDSPDYALFKLVKDECY